MIITRAPLRISFAGGGSDLPVFYKRHGGCALVTSINRYVYIEIHPFFNEDRIHLKYSQTENVGRVHEIKHKIFRAVLKQFHLTGVELSCTADIPAGTGLGSSSAFSAALLKAVYAYKNRYCSRADIAAGACELEMKRLKSPIGKQDQYASVFGGMNFIRFNRDGTVAVEPIIAGRRLKDALGDRLHLYYTGKTRDANAILAEQQKSLSGDPRKERMVMAMAAIAAEMKTALEQSDLSGFGHLLHEGWLLKKGVSKSISNDEMDGIYQKGLSSGAGGGKLLGAGGGGFFLFYVDGARREKFLRGMARIKNIKRMDFALEQNGLQVVHCDPG
ncbi:MAG: GHMP kinase [Candidatus Omnitrophica bacterium]|nr:GHMP kinase [Candidatus Omnitrophota bacterium]